MTDAERDVWHEAYSDSEGISVTTYSQVNAAEPVVEDETWWTWDEIEAMMEVHRD